MHPNLTPKIESTCEYCGAGFAGYRRSTGKAPRYCSGACYHAARKGTQPPGGFQAIPAEDRFWEKVDRSGGPDACWPWMAGRDDDGYGKFNVTRRKSVPAHRFAYELTYGPIPPGLNGCHTCDSPPCCNPAHVFPGTQAENRADCVAKGRQAKGERMGAFTHPESLRRGDDHWTRQRPEQVARGERSGRHTKPECTARGDRHGYRTHPERMPRGERVGTAKLTWEKVRAIRAAYSTGLSQQVIADSFGVSQSAVSRIVIGKTWRE